MEQIKIDLSFEQDKCQFISWLVKQKTLEAAFEYLIKKKNSQRKIQDLQYSMLEI